MQSLTLEGVTYELSSLPKTAIDTLVSVQFVETRLQQLQAELAVCQTAHVAYARSLKAELEQKAPVETE
jgi:hypothetical protein